MRLRMPTIAAGPDFGPVAPGDVVDVPGPYAIALVVGGYAEAVDPLPDLIDPLGDLTEEG